MRQGTAERRRRARTYVHVVVAAARREVSWDGWENDLRLLTTVLDDDYVRAFLEGADVPVAERINLVDRVAQPVLGAFGLGLLRVLVTCRDTELIREIERGFLGVADKERRLDRVHVTTAVPMGEQEADELHQRLVRPGHQLHLTTNIDATIIGGLVVRRGDNLLDLSVRARLQSLGRALR